MFDPTPRSPHQKSKPGKRRHKEESEDRFKEPIVNKIVAKIVAKMLLESPSRALSCEAMSWDRGLPPSPIGARGTICKERLCSQIPEPRSGVAQAKAEKN